MEDMTIEEAALAFSSGLYELIKTHSENLPGDVLLKVLMNQWSDIMVMHTHAQIQAAVAAARPGPV